MTWPSISSLPVESQRWGSELVTVLDGNLRQYQSDLNSIRHIFAKLGTLGVKDSTTLLGSQGQLGQEAMGLDTPGEWYKYDGTQWVRMATAGGSGDLHDPVTLGDGSDPILSLSGQVLTLGTVAVPGDLHDPVTLDAVSDSHLHLTGQVLKLDAVASPGDLHAPVTLGAGNDSALALLGQQLTLTKVWMTPSEHTAIGDDSPHHAPVTLALDNNASLSLSSGQELTLSNNPTFAGLTIGTLTGMVLATAGVISAYLPQQYLGKQIEIVCPYVAKTHVYKGQIHCHTTNSDGVQSPTDVVTAYRNAGYDFINVSDHDFLTPDPGVSGILYIAGVEETQPVGHVVRINATSQSTSADPQTIIDEIIADNGIADMAHPDWVTSSWSDQELESIVGYAGLEVYNSNPVVNPTNDASDKWDTILGKYRKVFGFAVDDCHNVTLPTFGTCALHVSADTDTATDVLDNIRRGNFYSTYTPAGSSEITLTVSVAGNVITASVDSSSTIAFIVVGGITKQSSVGTSASYTVNGDEVYVRIVITRGSSKAWSNPVYVNCAPVMDLASGGVVRGNAYITGKVVIGTNTPASTIYPLWINVPNNLGLVVNADTGYSAIWLAQGGVPVWSMSSGFDADGAFLIRETGVSNRIKIAPTTGLITITGALARGTNAITGSGDLGASGGFITNAYITNCYLTTTCKLTGSGADLLNSGGSIYGTGIVAAYNSTTPRFLWRVTDGTTADRFAELLGTGSNAYMIFFRQAKGTDTTKNYFRIKYNGDIVPDATGDIYLGSATGPKYFLGAYITTLNVSSTASLDGSVASCLTGTGALTCTLDLGLVSGKKLYLDGVARTGDTYIYESGANVMDLYAGDVNILRLEATTATVTGNLTLTGRFVGEYQSQSGAWADPSGTAANGRIVTVYNSTAAASRFYAYSNGTWHYVALT